MQVLSKSAHPFTDKLQICIIPIVSHCVSHQSYLQNQSVSSPRVTTASTSTARLIKENDRIQTAISEFESYDEISTISEIIEKLEGGTSKPSNFQTFKYGDCFIIGLIDIIDNIPKIVASITVNESLEVTVVINEILMSKQLFSDLIPNRLTLY